MNAYQIHVRTMENVLMASTIITATVHQGIMVQTATEVCYAWQQVAERRFQKFTVLKKLSIRQYCYINICYLNNHIIIMRLFYTKLQYALQYFVNTSVCLSVCLSVRSSICLHICLSVTWLHQIQE